MTTKLHILVKLKGGPGSGHHGHAGRPGKRGGSVPGSAWSAPTKDRIWDTMGPHLAFNPNMLRDALPDTFSGDPTAFIYSTYDYTDKESGLRAEISGVTLSYDRINIHGIVYDKDGNMKGSFDRHLKANGEVDHSTFIIDMDVQGAGFGSRFYQHCEDNYRKAGYTHITLQANSSVGGYAWARMGFDFVSDVDRHDAARRIAIGSVKHMLDAGAIDIIDSMSHVESMTAQLKNSRAWELAAFAIDIPGQGMVRVGKEQMLGSGWRGVKYLDPSGEYSAAGNIYYDAKK